MFFALLSLAAGIGTSIYGASKQAKETKKANKSIGKANAAQREVTRQNQIASAASVRAEAARKQQMELEGIRRRRDIIRQAQGARALGIARANQSGAATTDSSVVASGQQLASQQRADTLANLQNIMIGRQIYKENINIYKAQAKGAGFQTQANVYGSQAQQSSNAANYGQQIFGMGTTIASTGPTLQRVASDHMDLFNSNPWQTTAYTANGYPLK